MTLVSMLFSLLRRELYLGLRSYGIEPSVWGGDPQHEHVWGSAGDPFHKGQVVQTKWSENTDVADGGNLDTGQFCECLAWRGCLGNEPTVELYIKHTVDIFREVRRVLRHDGTVWLNLGDSWAGSGKGPTGWNGIGNQEQRQGFAAGYLGTDGSQKRGGRKNKTDAQDGYKAKDKMLVPYLVADALRRDGWYLRDDIPWLKANSLPESVRDRTVNSKEVVFLLAKSQNYYYDAEAVRLSNGREEHPDIYAARIANGTWQSGGKDNYAGAHKAEATGGGMTHPGGRGRRNTDAATESLDALIRAQADYLRYLRNVRRDGGLLLDSGEDSDPLAFLVNPKPLDMEWCMPCEKLFFRGERDRIVKSFVPNDDPEAPDKWKPIRFCPDCGNSAFMSHFASYPVSLVKPGILASTSEVGVCRNCWAPWKRVVGDATGGFTGESWREHSGNSDRGNVKENSTKDGGRAWNTYAPGETKGWEPSCDCKCWACDGTGLVKGERCEEGCMEGIPRTIPATVLDIFGGTGTTAVAADELGRDSLMIEIKPEYAAMGQARFYAEREARAVADRVERESRLGQSSMLDAIEKAEPVSA